MLADLDSSDIQNAAAMTTTNQFINEKYGKSFNLSIETFLEKNKPIVIEKNEIEYPPK